MGILSKIKKPLSKAWKGVKKTVKKVARTVKKVAKKVAYSTPWGKKLWDFSSKVGKAVMKGVGKITSALGPVGTMALSFVLAPVMGPMLGALWASFGTGAAALAGSANAFLSTLGTIGNGIYAAGNFIGGTLGAMGEALSQGASNVMQGEFSAAASSFASNMGSALSGEAGMAAVNSAAATAASQAGTLLGQGVDATAAVQSGVDASFASQNLGTATVPDVPLNLSQTQLGVNTTAGSFNPAVSGVENIAQEAITGKVGTMSLAEQGAFVDYGAEGVRALQPNATAPVTSDSDTLKKLSDTASNLLGNGPAESQGFNIDVPNTQATAIKAASGVSGQGSSGFSLLSGVEGLEQSVRNSQRLMFG